MRYSYASPDTLTNDVRLRGFLTEDASLFVVSPSGQPHLKLRLRKCGWTSALAVCRRSSPPKSTSFQSCPLNPSTSRYWHSCRRGREVLVRGMLQSRDVNRPEVGERRVVIEVVVA